jgi:DNA (cytosine-5)-methyltransferase 1
MDKYASATLRTRALYHALHENNKDDIYYDYVGNKTTVDSLSESVKDINVPEIINKEITEENQEIIADEITDKMKLKGIHKVDVMIGGPPCQTYSVIRRFDSKIEGRNWKDDPRNYLFKRYVYFLQKFSPDIFVFENVPGIKSANGGEFLHNFVTMVNKAGYNITEKILNAKDFMVLQQRKREIIIGWKKGYKLDYPEFQTVEHNYNVGKLLNDLPGLEPGQGDYLQEYKSGASDYLEKTGIRKHNDILIQHKARYHNERDRRIYRYVINEWNTNHRHIKYGELPAELRPYENTGTFSDKFKVVASDLNYSQTITAHLSRDGHYYIHPDIEQARSITVREAARLQSFPDNFKFEGPVSAQYRQIGNAVPPIMAKSIALKIKKMLDEI